MRGTAAIFAFALHFALCSVPASAVDADDAKAREAELRRKFEETKKSAEAGDSTAQFKLGLMYAGGDGVARNDGEAVKWYLKAAEQGEPAAECNLGVMYSQGRGVPKSDAEAVRWYRKAAEHGQSDGAVQPRTELPARRRRGIGSGRSGEVVPQGGRTGGRDRRVQPGRALRARLGGRARLRRSRQMVPPGRRTGRCGRPEQSRHLLQRGAGVPKDNAEALKWYRKAAAQECALARNNIGLMYLDGLGVAKDEREAVKWFRMSAAQDSQRASTTSVWCMTTAAA